MDRDHYKFRAKARIVAFVDLILSSMSLCLCLILFVGLLRITSLVSADDQSVNSKIRPAEGMKLSDLDDNKQGSDIMKENPTFLAPNKAFINIMWIFLALISIITGVQILAAVRLLNATQLGKDAVGAVKLCRFWRRVCMFFTALLVFNFLSTFRQRGENFFEVSFLLTSMLIRIVALYTVQQFINELDGSLRGQPGTIRIHNLHHQQSQNMPPDLGTGDNVAYAYGPHQAYPMPSTANAPPPKYEAYAMPSQGHVPPPKYEDVVKEPYNFNAA